jgi:hypothetical protein
MWARRVLRLAVLSSLILTTSCALYFSPAKRVRVDATFVFLTPSGAPFANQKAQVVETVGNGIHPTHLTRTDQNGEVPMDGFYCSPAFVQVDGGSVMIHAANHSHARFEVIVEPPPKGPKMFFSDRPSVTSIPSSKARSRNSFAALCSKTRPAPTRFPSLDTLPETALLTDRHQQRPMPSFR